MKCARVVDRVGQGVEVASVACRHGAVVAASQGKIDRLSVEAP